MTHNFIESELRRLPSDWSAIRLGHLLSRNDSGVWGEEPTEKGVAVLRSTDMTLDGKWSVRDPAYRTVSKTEGENARLAFGDIVVTKSSGSKKHLGKAAFVTKDIEGMPACFSNFMQRLRLDRSSDSRYFWYVLNSPVGRSQLLYWGTTTTGLANLNGSLIARTVVPRPPLGEQRAIVRFLDEETANIDSLIVKKLELVRLLAEELRALITSETWPAALPPGWYYSSLMHLVQPNRPIMYGIVLPGPSVPEGIPIVKGGDVTYERFEVRLLNKTTLDLEAPYARARLGGGDLLLTIRGRYGDTALVPDELTGASITQDIARIAPKEGVHGRWLLHVLRSEPIRKRVDSEALGAAVKGVNIRDVKRYVVPVPPMDEQAKLAERLDEQLDIVTSTQTILAQAVKRLKEYRAALITAAVTGQIDVPGAA